MFRNNKVNLVISILLAIILWAYVVGQVNPQTKKTFVSIPVTITNENILWNQGLAIEDPGELVVDVTISGTRRAVNDVDKSDIKVTADVSGLSRGQNTVTLKVTKPEGVKISKISDDTVTITVSDLETKTVETKARFTGGTGDSLEPGNVTISPSEVTVSGTKTQVDKVKYARASVQKSQIKDSATTVTAGLTPVTSSGKTVSHVRMSDSSATVTATMLQKKEVNLKVSLTGSVPEGYKIESKNVPKKVTIKGSKDTLDSIDSITADDISLSDITSTQNIALSLQLPDGVELADESSGLYVRIVMQDMQTAEFDFDEGDITVSDVSDGLTDKIASGTFKVKVTAAKDYIDKLSAADIKLNVSMSGYTAGTHTVTIKVSCSNASEVTVSPETVKVTLSEK
ncbi:MAG: YbbR-like domain-containing protein [Anaerovoracaceae bacterium]